jgi:predicted nucleic acid-binding protein
MKRYLMDSSFVIDLVNEMEERLAGPAVSWMRRRGVGSSLWMSPVTVAEVLEGAADWEATKGYLAKFQWRGIDYGHAEKVARRQCRSRFRLGENDAWQVAVAESLEAVIVGHDPAAFSRLGAGYEDHRAPA